MIQKCRILILAICLIFAAVPLVNARALFDIDSTYWNNRLLKPSDEVPNQQYDAHNIGKIAMTISNWGVLGTGYLSNPIIDGELAPSLEYPNGSNLSYLFTGAIWIGAVVGRDTLVSGGADGWGGGTHELKPDAGAAGAIVRRSSLRSSNAYSPDAISEQDFLCVYTDTVLANAGTDGNDNRPHIPLNIRVEQNSYAWSYDYAEDFILFDFHITNIGPFPIRELFMALYIDADVHHESAQSGGYLDDICGFRHTVDMPHGSCLEEDTVNIAYISDNDGDPTNDGQWTYTSTTSVTGIRVVRTPNEDLSYSFNWWISNGNPSLDFGPRLQGTDDDPFRSFGSHLGTPTGDRTKYYVMSHPEFDYDQLYTALSHVSQGYLPPPKPSQAEDFANGYDTRYLLSFGPFDVAPGDTLPITLAYLAGEHFHTDPNNFKDNFDAFNPDIFYNNLSFEDFGLNARWASWIYDNPGYDTDGDGDSGKFCWDYVWVSDSLSPGDSIAVDSSKFYYTGDGIPDFRGASPPPPPKLNVIPGFGRVAIRWNGQETENAVDVFSGRKDFEGYKVYMGEGEQASDFVLLATYDLDDYKVYEFDPILRVWEQISLPLTRDSLKTMFGQDFNPDDYYNEFNYYNDPYANPVTYPQGRQMYFVRQDWNASDLTDPHGIHKLYPSASKNDPSDTTDEGKMRYYEYEYNIENIRPSTPYYFSVTAFDYGSLKAELGSLETSPLVNAVLEYPLSSAEVVEQEGLEVIVYPNPYRIDASYANAGYENRDRTKSAERSRAIHFANLPKVCTIRIYSLDGDLIKEMEHYYPEGGPGSQHETWNVISRNTQAVVTGIYLWHVESEMGEQLGKLVIMK